MFRIRLRMGFIMAAALIILLFSNVSASGITAQEPNKGYTIDSYNVNIKVNENYSYDVTENIIADFKIPKHGIYRDIPFRGKLINTAAGEEIKSTYRARISDIYVKDGETGESVKYSTDTEPAYLQIKIGDTGNTYTGKRHYVIHYLYTLNNDGISSFDEMFYNIIGTEWDTSIGGVSFDIQMPKTFNKDEVKFNWGKDGFSDKTGIEYKIDENRIIGRLNETLNPGEGLTVKIVLPEGYFSPIKQASYTPKIILFWIMALISIIFYAVYGERRRFKNHDSDDFPDGLTPADVYYIIKGNIDTKGITAMIPYWASMGLISIEYKGNKDYTLIKLKDCHNGMNPHERLLFQKMFEDSDRVNTKDLNSSFYKTVNLFRKSIKSYYKEPSRRLFTVEGEMAMYMGYLMSALIMTLLFWHDALTLCYSPSDYIGVGVCSIILVFAMSVFFSALLGNFADKRYMGSKQGLISWSIIYVIVLVSFALVWGNITGDYVFNIMGVLFAAVSAAAGAFSHRRTEQGYRWLTQLLNLRQFIAAKYGREDNNSEIFFRWFPYAYVLGVTRKWAAKFEDIDVESPEWFSGTETTGFSAMYYTSIMSHTMSDCGANMISGDPAGSSGFSGGGTGGGGGGSW